ncbi:hypothetical protein [Chitinophaga vietnamensis]|uniref:hypothetical protein n=1 Tax=Chitinophaga vietnamensis TaxID=2593957 RepID=UPI0011784824|nr:hypothetical protein [Chitinophaga vietnamensis]
MSNCQCHTEVTRDGSGQLGRYLAALDPAYAAIDARSTEDLLVFARKYAAQLRFYDVPESNVPDRENTPGTAADKVSWKEFFRRDMAVIAAAIGTFDPASIKKEYDEVRTALDLHPDTAGFESLFKPIIGIMVKLDGWYTLAIPDNPLHADLLLAIQSILAGQVKRMIAYAEGYRTVDVKKTITLDFTDIENDNIWKVNDPVEADDTIFTGDTMEDKIRNGALYIDEIFLSFFGVITNIIHNGDGYLKFALEQYPAHQPHMGLFIAFLQLFKLAQEQMNGLTAKMLDFYYRDVLHLTEKPSIPDRAHVVFELAKDVAEYAIAPGTALLAGKDPGGKDQVYATENGIVINQAKVKELKTIHVYKTPDDIKDNGNNKIIETIYARPVANSQDGMGAKFTDPYPKWPTFGVGQSHPDQFTNSACDVLDNTLPSGGHRSDIANIGFALATPELVLQGGKRMVAIYFNGIDRLIQAMTKDTDAPFDIWLTTDQGWYHVDTRNSKQTVYTSRTTTGLFPTTSDANDAFYDFVDDKQQNRQHIVVYLPVTAPAVIGFNTKLHDGAVYNTPSPVMKILLKSTINLSKEDYNGFQLNNLRLETWVGSISPDPDPTSETGLQTPPTRNYDGLKTLVLETENGLQAIGKTFSPFTFFPTRGKSFYVGSEEVFNKSLSALAVNIKRTNEIDGETGSIDYNLPTIYYGASIRQNSEWVMLTVNGNTSHNAFSPEDLSRNILKNLPEQPSCDKLPFCRYPVMPVTTFKGDTIKGFISISNRYDAYPRGGSSGYYNANSAVDINNIQLAQYFEVKELAVSYYSVLSKLEKEVDQFFHVYPFGIVEVDPNTSGGNFKTDIVVKDDVKTLAAAGNIVASKPLINRKVVNFNSLLPGHFLVQSNPLLPAHDRIVVDGQGLLLPQFTYKDPYDSFDDTGSENVGIANDANTVRSLRRTNDLKMGRILLNLRGLGPDSQLNQYSGEFQEEGMLFIGLENLQPLQTLSLLFEFADGTAEDDQQEPPPIHWSYLTNNEWRPLKGEAIVSDGTFGLQTTGIVQIDIPEDITTNNTIITSGLSWLCASVTWFSNTLPQLINIVAQAVEVRFQDNNNDQRHFDKALPAGSINKLAVKVAEVSKVDQPFASFDGKHKEVGREFYTRVSERLRHKGRAITAWDFEHLVLDRYPSIYKVKCLPDVDPDCVCWDSATETDANGKPLCCGPQKAPGHVLVVPLANLKNRTAINPLQPKTSRRTLLEMEAYLQKRTSPFVKVHARNPVYEQVLVRFRVKFIAGADKGYYLKQLNSEIVQYLTPWAFDDQAEVIFGQKIYASAVINFIEERPYVDFITDFTMMVCLKDCCHGSKHETNDNNYKDIKIEDVRNCDDLEAKFALDAATSGVIVAVPSTPRSILVSVPQHFIAPYIEPDKPTPCEEAAARATMTNVGKATATGGTPVAMAPAPANTIVKMQPAEIVKPAEVTKATEIKPATNLPPPPAPPDPNAKP